jgi:hypothetical protein
VANEVRRGRNGPCGKTGQFQLKRRACIRSSLVLSLSVENEVLYGYSGIVYVVKGVGCEAKNEERKSVVNFCLVLFQRPVH